MEQAKREIKDYFTFKPGWDGYRAEPFALKTIDQALAQLRLVNTDGLRELCPGPCSDGSIDLELRYEDGRIEFICIDGDNITRETVKTR